MKILVLKQPKLIIYIRISFCGMANEPITIFDTTMEILKFNLPSYTIGVDLKIHILRDIHTYRKEQEPIW